MNRTREYQERYELAVIGISNGGLDTLHVLLSQITPDSTLPLIIVQHRMESEVCLADLLSKSTKRRVVEVEDREIIKEGHIYIAPADYHVLVEKGRMYLSMDEPCCFARPSIDVLLASAADAYRQKLIGIIMTGSGYDGVEGLKAVGRRGGLTVVQNPQDAFDETLPLNVLKSNRGYLQKSVGEIAAILST